MSGPNDLTIKLGLDDTGLPAPVQRVNTAIASIGKTGETSARQTAAAMRQLPAQFTDIATQLAGGQNPLLIAMQQGGQIKDSFGGIGPTLAVLSGYITATSVAVGGLAAGVGTLAVAAVQGSRDAKELRDTIALTGNAAGLTGARLQALSESVSENSKQTVGSAREILMALASSGQVSSAVLADTARAVARVAELSGQDAAKVAADFATMGNGVAKWAAEHNKTWNFLTYQQYKYIERLEEQGKAEQAAVVVNRTLLEQMKLQGAELGVLEDAWQGLGRYMSKFWEDAKSVGRNSLKDQLDSARQSLSIAQNVAGTPALEWALGKPEEWQARIGLINRAMLRAEEQASARSAAAAESRKKIADDLAAKSAPAGRKEKPYIPSQFQVLDARDGMILAAAREKAESTREGFFQDALRKDDERREARLTKDAEFLQQMVDANDRAALELIADERMRGEALIKLDREIALRRLQAQSGLGDGVRAQAQQEIDRKARLAYQAHDGNKQAAEKLGDDAGKATYDGVHNALSEAFRDTNDPLRAFGNALANTIFTRASASLIDALAAAAVGRDGQGGGLGSLLGLFGGGSGIDAASQSGGLVDKFANVPALASGTNYVPRNMLAFLHEGESVQPRQYNPAAGGSGGVAVTQNVSVQVDSRTDREQVVQLVFNAVQQGNNALLQDLQARGVLV